MDGIERLFSTVVAEMSQAFFDIAQMTFGISQVDTQAETVQVAAGSVVRGRLEPYSIYAGAPAQRTGAAKTPPTDPAPVAKPARTGPKWSSAWPVLPSASSSMTEAIAAEAG